MRRKSSNESSSIFSELLTGQLIQKMPEDVWLKFAWMLCVDSKTYSDSQIIRITNGTMVVQCSSVYAANYLDHPTSILERWRKLNLTRALPPVTQITISLSQLNHADKPTNAIENAPPSATEIQKYTAAVQDPILGKMLAGLAAKRGL